MSGNNVQQNPNADLSMPGIGATYAANATDGVSDSDPSAYMTPDALMVYCESRLGNLDSQMKSYFADQQHAQHDEEVLHNVENEISQFTNGFRLDDKGNHPGPDLMLKIQDEIDKLPEGSPLRDTLVSIRDRIATSMDGTGDLARMIDANPRGVLNDMKTHMAPDMSDDAIRARANGKYPPDVPGSDTDYICQVVHHGDPSGKGLPPGEGRQITTDIVQSWSKIAQDAAADLGSKAQMGMIQLQSLMSQRQMAIQLCTNLVQALGEQSKNIAGNVGH